MSAKAAPVETVYRGFRVTIDSSDIMVVAPDGDLAFFSTMVSVRTWVKRKRRELGMP